MYEGTVQGKAGVAMQTAKRFETQATQVREARDKEGAREQLKPTVYLPSTDQG